MLEKNKMKKFLLSHFLFAFILFLSHWKLFGATANYFNIDFSFRHGKTNQSIPLIYINQFQAIFNVKLSFSNQSNLENLEFYTKIITLSSNDFIMKNSNIQLSVDEDNQDFYLAAKKSTSPGIYNITLNTEGENKTIINSNRILIEVVLSKCEIKTDILTYTLPMKGQTFPIVIDFSDCKPVLTLEIFARIENNQGVFTFDDGFLNKRIIIGPNVKNKLFVFIKSNFDELGQRNFNYSNNPWVEWNMSNAEGNAYFSISKRTDLKVSFMRNYEFFKLKPLVNFLKNNELEIIFIFQQEIFYFFSLIMINHQNQESPSHFYSIYKKVMTSEREKNDSYLKEYYDIAFDFVKSSKFEVKFKNLRPNTNYSLIYYYANHFKISEQQEIIFTTPDNFSRYVKLSLKLGRKINSFGKQTLACLLALKYKIKKNRVWTDEGMKCYENILNESISFASNERNLKENNQILLTPDNYSLTIFFDICLDYDGCSNFLEEISSDFSNVLETRKFFSENEIYFGFSSLEVLDSNICIKSKEEILNFIVPQMELINIEILNQIQNEDKIDLVLRIRILNSNGFIFLGLCEDNKTTLNFFNLRNNSCLTNKCQFRNVYLQEDKKEELIFNNMNADSYYYGFYITGGDYAPIYDSFTYSNVQNFTFDTYTNKHYLQNYLINSFICSSTITISLLCAYFGFKIWYKKKLIYTLHLETSI